MIHGRARLFGDNVNTDYIISSRRKRETLDPAALRQHLFEDLDPHFAATLAPGDLIVAGKNFGCGSAMEVAVTVLTGAGMKAVLARSFSRTYYRNAVNNGLIPVACDTSLIREGDSISIDVAADGNVTVRNETTATQIAAEWIPTLLLSVIHAGGLAPFIKEHGWNLNV